MFEQQQGGSSVACAGLRERREMGPFRTGFD